MGSTLEHGIYLPSEGEKNCYQGLAGNWNKVDGALGDVAELKQLIENKFTKEIVTELPTEDINPYCIYLILKTDPETDNIYDEWVYINNAWEYLGNTKVDMTQYYTKQEVNQLPAVASGVTSTKVGNYDAHIANGDIHVTASDKAKWNTVALIKQLRLVNTQVGSATTIAFANIDDTNGIKVGDKCMDLDGKMFEITAVDTTNQTVTVGTALIDLALDANVVHTSGNETVGGIKTFNSDTFIYNSDNTANTPNLILRSSKIQVGDTSNSDTFGIVFSAGSSFVSRVNVFKDTSGTQNLQLAVRTKDSSNNLIYSMIRLRLYANGFSTFESDGDNLVSLGSSSNKWKNVQTYQINGLTPSSLSLPSNTGYVDITGYFTNTGDGQTNSYTASVNGWIYLNVVATTLIMQIRNGNDNIIYADMRVRSSDGTIYMTIPIGSGNKLLTQWFTSSSVTVTTARFIPCQGNI